MTAHRVTETLKRINAELSKPQTYETMKALKRGLRKWNKELKQFTDPNAPARDLPKSNDQLKLI
jgi:hypothetical protein